MNAMPNRLSYVLLAVGCLLAAAGGGYLAVRQGTPASATAANTNPPALAADAAPAAASAAPSSTTPSAVVPHAAEAGAASAPNPDAPALRDRGLRSRDARASVDPAPAPLDTREPAVEAAPARRQPASVKRAAPPAPAAGRAPQPGPVAAATATPIASTEWQAIEQGLQNGNPAPPAPAAGRAKADLPIEQFVISSDSVIGLELDAPLSSETARVEDPVEARISRDVKVGDKVAIPAGTLVRGTVTEVERGGKLHTQARLGLSFTTIVMPDGAEVPISTDTVFREGNAPGAAAERKIGAGAVAGTILGAIFGGGRGALLGGAAGAAGGTALAEAGDRHPAEFPAGAPITVRLNAPVTVTVEEK